MTSPYDAAVALPRIPTRPLCHRCQRYITIDTEADDGLWAEVIGEKFGPGYICADCFTRAADERLIPWEGRLRLVPYSLASQMIVQAEVANTRTPARDDVEPLLSQTDARVRNGYGVGDPLDAARYRWLRTFPNNVRADLYAPCQLLMREEYLDAAIDAAMAALSGRKK